MRLLLAEVPLPVPLDLEGLLSGLAVDCSGDASGGGVLDVTEAEERTGAAVAPAAAAEALIAVGGRFAAEAAWPRVSVPAWGKTG